MATSPHLLLVGGGHAHIEILRRLAADDHPPVRVTLVSPHRRHHYSGMAPGFVAGIYDEDELAFELEALSAAAGGRLILDAATAVDPRARRVELADGAPLTYDLVSFDIGSRAAGVDTPGVREHALSVKPLSRAVEVRRRLEALAGDGTGTRRVVVVGAGSAGTETAFAAAALLRRHRVDHHITLLEAGPRILAAYDHRTRRLTRQALDGHGIRVETDAAVTAVRHDHVNLDDGRDLPTHLTLWLTGPAAPRLFAGSGLPLDDRGYLLVDDTLRAPGHADVFGAGDCVTPTSWTETPKAGVYAVRESPVLWASLTTTLAGRDPASEGVRYEPQRGYLSLLNTCDGQAVLSWKGLSFHNRLAWWLKDWIDRRFVRRYQRLSEGRAAPPRP